MATIDIENPGANEAALTAALRALLPRRGCKVKKSADQTTANYSSLTALTWDSEDIDTDGFHDVSTNSERITVPAGLGGIYIASAWVSTSAGTVDDQIRLLLYHNNSSSTTLNLFANTMTPNSVSPYVCVTSIIPMSAGDYVEARLQDADTSITIVSASSGLSLWWLSP